MRKMTKINDDPMENHEKNNQKDDQNHKKNYQNQN